MGFARRVDGDMVKRFAWLGALIVLVAFGLMVRTLFPKHIDVVRAPRIVTHWDTVRVLDTAWITRLRIDTVKINVLERVTVTVPETLYACPQLAAITAVSAGARVGDSSIVGGFTLTPLDSGYARRAWIAQFYTLGPVRSVVMDGDRPRMNFYDPPPRGCGFWCALGHYVTGGTIGAGAGFALCKAT